MTKKPPEKSKINEILRINDVLAGRTTGAGMAIMHMSVMIFLRSWSVTTLGILKLCVLLYAPGSSTGSIR